MYIKIYLFEAAVQTCFLAELLLDDPKLIKHRQNTHSINKSIYATP